MTMCNAYHRLVVVVRYLIAGWLLVRYARVRRLTTSSTEPHSCRVTPPNESTYDAASFEL